MPKERSGIPTGRRQIRNIDFMYIPAQNSNPNIRERRHELKDYLLLQRIVVILDSERLISVVINFLVRWKIISFSQITNKDQINQTRKNRKIKWTHRKASPLIFFNINLLLASDMLRYFGLLMGEHLTWTHSKDLMTSIDYSSQTSLLNSRNTI